MAVGVITATDLRTEAPDSNRWFFPVLKQRSNLSEFHFRHDQVHASIPVPEIDKKN